MNIFLNDHYKALFYMQQNEAKILDHLVVPLKQSELCELASFSKIKLLNIIKDLINENYITKETKGRYIILDKGRTIVKDMQSLKKLNPQFKRLWIPVSYSEYSICYTKFIPYVCKNAEELGFLDGVLNSETFQNYLLQSAISSTGSRKRVLPELCDSFKLPYLDNEEIIHRYCTTINDAILE